MGAENMPKILIPVKLRSDIYNYREWKFFSLSFFHHHHLSGIIDGTEPPPGLQSQYPDFIKWRRRDQEALNWLKATLSDGLRQRVMARTDSARKVWLNLEAHLLVSFTLTSIGSNIICTKRGNMPLCQWLTISNKSKSWRRSLHMPVLLLKIATFFVYISCRDCQRSIIPFVHG
ncbi:hypothetical protein CerSpe_248820 [Prunus speciosa]